MPAAIPEPDWKLFRTLRADALQRYCQEILNEISVISNDPEKSPHARYLEIYQLIHERDETLAEAFNNPRRSTATFQLLDQIKLGLLTDEELSGFSEVTQAYIRRIRP